MAKLLKRIVRFVVHTQDIGEGRVLAVSFFGGAGYLWRRGIWTFGENRPHRLTYVNVRGATLYVRLKGKRAERRRAFGTPLGLVGATANANKYDLF